MLSRCATGLGWNVSDGQLTVGALLGNRHKIDAVDKEMLELLAPWAESWQFILCKNLAFSTFRPGVCAAGGWAQ